MAEAQPWEDTSSPEFGELVDYAERQALRLSWANLLRVSGELREDVDRPALTALRKMRGRSLDPLEPHLDARRTIFDYHLRRHVAGARQPEREKLRLVARLDGLRHTYRSAGPLADRIAGRLAGGGFADHVALLDGASRRGVAQSVLRWRAEAVIDPALGTPHEHTGQTLAERVLGHAGMTSVTLAPQSPLFDDPARRLVPMRRAIPRSVDAFNGHRVSYLSPPARGR